MSETYLITGGTGSLGQAIVKRLLSKRVGKVIVFSRNEQNQVEMRRGLDDRRVRFFIGDIRDRFRINRAMSGVDVVIHAAALKHVEIAEYNPDEAVSINVEGTKNVRDAAISCGVGRALLISSDKSCNAGNIYGATKYCAEKIFSTASAYAGADGCRFASIRCGNFLGSSGSVVPLFKKIAGAGGDEPIPITDMRMTRFVISFDDAVDRVFEVIKMMKGGEVFCPKMSSMKVIDIARSVAPGRGIKEVGIRAGEKLYEELVADHEASRTRSIKNFYVIYPDFRGNGECVADGFTYRSDTNSQWIETLTGAYDGI